MVKVNEELNAFFLNKEDQEDDPLNVTADAHDLLDDQRQDISLADLGETYSFFQDFKRRMVREIPMQTTLKCRYASGTDLKHLRSNEVPEMKNFWVANAERLANVATQQMQEGCYSTQEEAEFIQYEKHVMLHPASLQTDQSSFDCADLVRQSILALDESEDEFAFSETDSDCIEAITNRPATNNQVN